MINNLKNLKKFYDFLADDRKRVFILKILDLVGVKKNVIRLDTNNVCTIECIMCSNKPQKCSAENFISFENFKNIINKINKKVRFLYLSCGFEPLMTPNFNKYLSYAKQKKIPFISFATNGLLLNKTIVEQLVKEQINEVVISINGLNEKDYNRIMFRSNFETLVKNLTYLKEYKENQNSIYPKIRVNIILLKSNLIFFDQLEELLNRFDIDTIQFRELTETEEANNPKVLAEEKIEIIPPEELHKLLDQIKNKIKVWSKKGKQIIFPLHYLNQEKSTPKSKEEKSLSKNQMDSLSFNQSCSLPFFSYWIDHLGQVKICPTDPEAIIGNLIQDDWKDLEKKSKNFRKKALTGQCQKNCFGVAVDSSNII